MSKVIPDIKKSYVLSVETELNKCVQVLSVHRNLISEYSKPAQLWLAMLKGVEGPKAETLRVCCRDIIAGRKPFDLTIQKAISPGCAKLSDTHAINGAVRDFMSEKGFRWEELENAKELLSPNSHTLEKILAGFLSIMNLHILISNALKEKMGDGLKKHIQHTLSSIEYLINMLAYRIVFLTVDGFIEPPPKVQRGRLFRKKNNFVSIEWIANSINNKLTLASPSLFRKTILDYNEEHTDIAILNGPLKEAIDCLKSLSGISSLYEEWYGHVTSCLSPLIEDEFVSDVFIALCVGRFGIGFSDAKIPGNRGKGGETAPVDLPSSKSEHNLLRSKMNYHYGLY